MIKKIVVANRGEIAVRIIRSCREMSITSVALYSDADRMSKHVMLADEAYNLGPAPSKESYLDINKIIDVAIKCGADAIHPGYGFLSENSEFARRCTEAGITFIGPRTETIDCMGDKISARQTMIAAGVPVVPGIERQLESADEARKVCAEIGFPVILKAASGGGGKGMRLVRSENEVAEAYTAAKMEALASFGDDTVYIEKYIEEPHHIEFQVLGDMHGNVIHLFDRECSVQRRHQKIVEESPSPFLTPQLRQQMGKTAVAAAKAVNYVGAGTIEFLVDKNYNYYFLEMNTRLQVEHPVTEEVLTIDLVKEQIYVASGMELHLKQEDVSQRGHSIECRICAEDPDNDFMPSPGLVKQITDTNGLGVRIDSYIYEGFEVPLWYDPMISKLIVKATTREYAIQRMRAALDEYKITGIKTNIPYLNAIINMPDFVKGNYDTGFLEKNNEALRTYLKENQPSKVDETLVEDMILIAAKINYLVSIEENGSSNAGASASGTLNRWREFGKRKGLMGI
jgi:acetyl-CoA carboxylase biotin carboxylase subunit